MSPVDNQLLRSVIVRRRKWSYRAAVIAASSVSLHEGGVYRTRRKRKGNRKRNRGFALIEMEQLDPSIFKKMFRVDRSTFDEIVVLISPFLRQQDERKARNSSGSPISLRTRLAVTLRWLAGASHWDLCFAWGLSSSSFYSPSSVLWPTITAINKAFKMGFPGNDEDRLEQLAAFWWIVGWMCVSIRWCWDPYLLPLQKRC